MEIRVRGLAWPILDGLGPLDPSSNLGGPTMCLSEIYSNLSSSISCPILSSLVLR